MGDISKESEWETSEMKINEGHYFTSPTLKMIRSLLREVYVYMCIINTTKDGLHLKTNFHQQVGPTSLSLMLTYMYL